MYSHNKVPIPSRYYYIPTLHRHAKTANTLSCRKETCHKKPTAGLGTSGRSAVHSQFTRETQCQPHALNVYNTASNHTNNTDCMTFTFHQNAAQLLALDSCSVGFAAFCPREALSSLPPNPRLPKPDPSTPRVLATMPADD